MATLLDRAADSRAGAQRQPREARALAVDLRARAVLYEGCAAALHTGTPKRPTPWLDIARGELGVKERRGGEHPSIIEYFKATSYHATEDEVPWCSAFACWCMTQAGLLDARRGSAPPDASARSWLRWGDAVATDDIQAGDVVVFWRGSPGGTSGHVGFVEEVVAGYVRTLGGNQSDSVRVSDYPVAQVLGVRRPSTDAGQPRVRQDSP
jgi:uncharacterized protein (TIGR02594 family)